MSETTKTKRATGTRKNAARASSKKENTFMSEILKDYCDTRTAADLLGIRIESVIRLIKEERLNGVQIGKSWMVYKPSIEEYYRTKAASGHPAAGTPKLAAVPK